MPILLWNPRYAVNATNVSISISMLQYYKRIGRIFLKSSLRRERHEHVEKYFSYPKLKKNVSDFFWNPRYAVNATNVSICISCSKIIKEYVDFLFQSSLRRECHERIEKYFNYPKLKRICRFFFLKSSLRSQRDESINMYFMLQNYKRIGRIFLKSSLRREHHECVEKYFSYPKLKKNVSIIFWNHRYAVNATHASICISCSKIIKE